MKDTDHKQPRRTEWKQQEEAEDNFRPVKPAATQTSLPEEGSMLREQSFSAFSGQARRHKGQECTAQQSTEAGQVQEAPHITCHRRARGSMSNETSDDEVSSDDSTISTPITACKCLIIISFGLIIQGGIKAEPLHERRDAIIIA
jgi:hypothetical protein